MYLLNVCFYLFGKLFLFLVHQSKTKNNNNLFLEKYYMTSLLVVPLVFYSCSERKSM